MKHSFIMENSNLEAIESLLSMSMKGLHHLFDHANIVEILRKPSEETNFFNFENMSKTQSLFLEFIRKESFEEKKEFLNSLSKEDYEMILRAYFYIVENTAKASHHFRH